MSRSLGDVPAHSERRLHSSDYVIAVNLASEVKPYTDRSYFLVVSHASTLLNACSAHLLPPITPSLCRLVPSLSPEFISKPIPSCPPQHLTHYTHERNTRSSFWHQVN